MGEERAWLVRAKVRGRDRLPAWLEHGYCAVGWYELGEITPGTERTELRARVELAYPDRRPGGVRAAVGNLDRFVNRMAPGDLIVTPHGHRLHTGRVASDPYHAARHEEAHRRDVAWDDPTAPLRRGELSEVAQAKLRTMLTVTDVSAIAAELR
jgi:5-methylcytosine-specific restriction enzyme B